MAAGNSLLEEQILFLSWPPFIYSQNWPSFRLLSETRKEKVSFFRAHISEYFQPLSSYLRHIAEVLRILGYDVVSGTVPSEWNVLWTHEYSLMVTRYQRAIQAAKPHQMINHVAGSGYYTSKVTCLLMLVHNVTENPSPADSRTEEQNLDLLSQRILKQTATWASSKQSVIWASLKEKPTSQIINRSSGVVGDFPVIQGHTASLRVAQTEGWAAEVRGGKSSDDVGSKG